MKAYKIELLVIDFDQLGSDEIKSILENSNYPNDCISPSAMRITEAEIGPWSDDNPLNSGKTRAAEYARIFPDQASAAANGWMPIETAPKDGTRFIGFHDGGIGFWRWQEKESYPTGWRDDFIYVYPIGKGPTHWQPIPVALQ